MSSLPVSGVPVFLPNGFERLMTIDYDTMRAFWLYGLAKEFPTVIRKRRVKNPHTQIETDEAKGNYSIRGDVVRVEGSNTALVFIPDPEHINTLRTIMTFFEKNKDGSGENVDIANMDYRNYPEKNVRFTKAAARVCAKVMKPITKEAWIYNPDYLYAAEYHVHYQFYRKYHNSDALLPKYIRKNDKRNVGKDIFVDAIVEKLATTTPDIVINNVPSDPILMYGETVRHLETDMRMNYTSNDNTGYIRLFGTMIPGRNVDGVFIAA